MQLQLDATNILEGSSNNRSIYRGVCVCCVCVCPRVYVPNEQNRRCCSGCHVHDQKIVHWTKTEARQMTNERHGERGTLGHGQCLSVTVIERGWRREREVKGRTRLCGSVTSNDQKTAMAYAQKQRQQQQGHQRKQSVVNFVYLFCFFTYTLCRWCFKLVQKWNKSEI